MAASTLAPLRSNSVTMLTWPSFEARCRAFNPFWNQKKKIQLLQDTCTLLFHFPTLDISANTDHYLPFCLIHPNFSFLSYVSFPSRWGDGKRTFIPGCWCWCLYCPSGIQGLLADCHHGLPLETLHSHHSATYETISSMSLLQQNQIFSKKNQKI